MDFLPTPRQPLSRRLVGLLAASSLAAWGAVAGLEIATPAGTGANIGAGGVALLAIFLSARTAQEAMLLRQEMNRPSDPS